MKEEQGTTFILGLAWIAAAVWAVLDGSIPGAILLSALIVRGSK